jgi:cytochrome c peroxidase
MPVNTQKSSRPLPRIGAAIILFAFSAVACAAKMDEPILPIPVPEFSSGEIAEIELGRLLFHDKRLSRDDSTSCASCHSLELDGVDRRPVSVGINGAMGTVNAPTVINSGLNIAQFWDGRADTLEQQVAGPVHNPIEMGTNWGEVVGKLRKDAAYPTRFESLYPDGLTAENIMRAIAQFERSLLTIDAPFDRYLRGDKMAISAEAKRGYRLFKSYGCVACHQGRNVGGNMFSRLGTIGDYFINKPELTQADLGRYNVTGDDRDRHVFKVPSLRLVTRTAPYFHDGSVGGLDEAIRIMARYQLGRKMSSEEVTAIRHFLESLAGTLYQVRP